MKWPDTILMVSPRGYRVEYAINPFMKDAQGRLKQVDAAKAEAQWKQIKGLYEKLGLTVEVLDGDSTFPDMVFCANQCFPFIDKNGRKSVVLSRMRSPERQGEVRHFGVWAESKGYQVHAITDCFFEGCGDALWNFETGEVFGGIGPRTEARAYDQLEKIIGQSVHRLKLCDPNFYHMDTCLSILNKNTAAYVEAAFNQEGRALLKQKFSNLIPIKMNEALECFAGNCFSPNGKDVLLHPGATDLTANLRQLGFTIHEINTSEFLKAGGSVFCMKQTLF